MSGQRVGDRCSYPVVELYLARLRGLLYEVVMGWLTWIPLTLLAGCRGEAGPVEAGPVTEGAEESPIGMQVTVRSAAIVDGGGPILVSGPFYVLRCETDAGVCHNISDQYTLVDGRLCQAASGTHPGGDCGAQLPGPPEGQTITVYWSE